MALNDNAPPQWSTFVRLVKQNMPALPAMSETRNDETRALIGRVAGVISSICDGVDYEIPGPVGHAINALSANSVGEFAQATGEGLVLSRVAGGTIIGGGLATLRGAEQSLDRSHQTLTYVLGVVGYLNTLGRMSLAAMMDDRHDTAYPSPVVPPDVQRNGDLFSASRRAKYQDGFNRAWRVVTELDNIRPADRTRDFYSKGCLAHVAMNTGQTRVVDGQSLIMRRRCEQLIAAQILNNDLQSQRERLRRWSNS